MGDVKVVGKQCTKCNLVQPLESFYLWRKGQERRVAWCKACAKVYNAAWEKKRIRVRNSSRSCSLPGCTTVHIAKGLCSKHYYRLCRKGTTADPETTEDRFWSKVEKQDSCWIWNGAIDSAGYGMMNVNNRSISSHRYSYILAKGTIPDGLHLDHLCRVVTCCNPDHLEAVTPRENGLRGFSPCAINARKTHCFRGHEFTDENTIQTREKYGRFGRRCRACDTAYKQGRRSA